MKITDVEAIVLRLPHVNAAADSTQDTCLVRIDTDEGISGWWEIDSCPEVVKAVMKEGHVSLTDAPGLGVTIDMDTVAKYRIQ